jgi:hypothetical protein
VHINERVTKSNAFMPVSYPNFVDWKRQQTSFSALAIYRNTFLNLTTETGTDRISALMVDHDFPVLIPVSDKFLVKALAAFYELPRSSSRFARAPAVRG